MEKIVIDSPRDLPAYTVEEVMQADCIQWYWNTYPEHRRMLFHVQQSAKNKIQGAHFKAIGVVAGVSDLVLILDRRTVYIELKLPGNTQSKEQVDFMNKVLARGQQYYLVFCFMGFKALVKSLLH